MEVNIDSDNWKYIKQLYELYSNEFEMLPLNLYIDGALKTFSALLRLLQGIEEDFESIFIKSVESIPGMKLYLLTHSVFEIDLAYSMDWFAKFINRYLVPTDEDLEWIEWFNSTPDAVKGYLDQFNMEYIHPYDDDILIYYGIWRWTESGRLASPIDVVDTADMPDVIVSVIDVKTIMDQYDVIDLSNME